jgi:hypothetical protein
MMADSFLESARKIGFNRAVARASRMFIVQTEVLGKDRLTIRTTVLERGVVRVAESTDGTPYTGELERVQAAAQAQHDAFVNRVERGELD